MYENRPVKLEMLPDDSGASVSLGNTRMHATITAELEKPRGTADGRLAIDLKFSPMASTAFTNVCLTCSNPACSPCAVHHLHSPNAVKIFHC